MESPSSSARPGSQRRCRDATQPHRRLGLAPNLLRWSRGRGCTPALLQLSMHSKNLEAMGGIGRIHLYTPRVQLIKHGRDTIASQDDEAILCRCRQNQARLSCTSLPVTGSVLLPVHLELHVLWPRSSPKTATPTSSLLKLRTYTALRTSSALNRRRHEKPRSCNQTRTRPLNSTRQGLEDAVDAAVLHSSAGPQHWETCRHIHPLRQHFPEASASRCALSPSSSSTSFIVTVPANIRATCPQPGLQPHASPCDSQLLLRCLCCRCCNGMQRVS